MEKNIENKVYIYIYIYIKLNNFAVVGHDWSNLAAAAAAV